MIEAYGRMTKERVFAEGQLMLKVGDYVRRGMAGPSKFAPKWEGPLVIKQAHQSGYYHLTQMDSRDLLDPINEKWLKRYYALKKRVMWLFLPFVLLKAFMFPLPFFFFFPSSDYVTEQKL